MNSQKYQSVKLRTQLVEEYRKLGRQTMIPLSRLIGHAMEQFLLDPNMTLLLHLHPSNPRTARAGKAR
jgi:hypothetical protein